MHIFQGETFAEAYQKSLACLMNAGEKNSARGGTHLELLNVALQITNPRAAMYKNAVRSSQFKYIAAELLYYYTGRNDAAFISKYAKMWDSIKNPDGTVNSAYGHLIFTELIPGTQINQYGWAIESLVMDKETRQAIIHFNNSSHQRPNNKDFVCTMYGNFHIRNNKLHFSVFMRSNDVVRGTATDVAFFCSLQVQMHKHLLAFYPNLELGTYTHVANSYHVYDTHYELVGKMLEQDFEPVELKPIVNDLIFSNGIPAEAMTKMVDVVFNDHELEIIFQNENDLMAWIWSKLKV